MSQISHILWVRLLLLFFNNSLMLCIFKHLVIMIRLQFKSTDQYGLSDSHFIYAKVNPLMLTAAKIRLKWWYQVGKKSIVEKIFDGWNVNRGIITNSPSNSLQKHCQFQSYFQNCHRSRRQLLKELNWWVRIRVRYWPLSLGVLTISTLYQ